MSTRWIQTFTGKKFFPLAARPQDVDLRDIAHALAFKCRFNGHCHTFYSVADHSLRVSILLEQKMGAMPCGAGAPLGMFAETTPEQKNLLPLWGLMHDAAEAYLADLSGPIKSAYFIHHAQPPHPPGDHSICPTPSIPGQSPGLVESFDAAEDRLLAIIAQALHFPPIDYEKIREADYTLLVTEARDLLSPPPEPWNMPQIPLPEKIIPLSPAQSQAAFLARFAELTRQML